MDTDGLSIICGGLGTIEEDESRNHIGYTKGEHCLDNLKDLLRFLRRDDPYSRDVFKQVCKWNVVGKDLVPMIEYHYDDRSLVLNAVKVLVFLTMPMEVNSKDANQQLEYLWGLKSAVTYNRTIGVIVSLLESPLENLECDAFTEDDWKLVQLMLTLFRNLLAVHDISAQQKAEGSVTHFLSLRDNFLELLFRENVMDLIIVLAQHVGDRRSYLRQDNLLLSEIFHYIFMAQDPEVIAKTCLTASKEKGDAEVCLESLRSLMEHEEEKKRQMRLQTLGRHSQFSGTFMSFTMDGSKALYKGMPVPTLGDSNLKSCKPQRGPVKKVVPDRQQVKLPTTKKNILELLYDFLNQFLSGGYNVLMQSILEDIEKDYHAIQDTDVLIFFQLAQFATSFQFHKCSMLKPNVEDDGCPADTDGDGKSFKGNVCGPIAASMNESMFLLVTEKWRYAFEGLKELKNHKFLSAAGSLMKIMIQMLDLVLKLTPEDGAEAQAAYVILYKLLYDQTDQGLTQFILNLVKSFSTVKQTKSDLANLVEILYLVIRLMENLQAHGTLRVSRKARKRRKKNKVDDVTNATSGSVADEGAVEKETSISGHDQCSEYPDIGIQVQEENAATASSRNEEKSGIPLPAGDKTGPSGFENAGSDFPEFENIVLNSRNDDITHAPGGDDFSSGDEQPLIDEVDFKINTLLTSLASSSIITNICWLLKFYRSNSSSTNHYIISILQRICYDMNLTPMLYQLSYLCIFYEILDEQKAYPCKEHEEIVTFLTTLVRRMLRKMKSQPLLFVEVLFSKSRRDCNFIDLETMKNDVGSMKAEVRKWGVNLDDPDGLSQQRNDFKRSMADALGEDEYDVVIPNEPDFEMDDNPEGMEMDNNVHISRDQASKSKARAESSTDDQGNGSMSGCLSRMEDHGGVTKKKRKLVLNSEVEKKVRGLFEKYKENRHCSRLIAEELHLDQSISPAQVSNLCKKLELKRPPRKQMNDSGKQSSDGNVEYSNGKGGKDASLPNSNNLADTSSLRRSLHTRKRVRAFDDEQEQKIRILFEQFKDHKKCSHMIANALDPDGKITVAQVTRKLKQLGLRSTQAKKRQPRTLLRDEELEDAQINSDTEDENLTLSSLRKRSKNMGSTALPSVELDPNFKREQAAHDSDDEILSSVIKELKWQRSQLEATENDNKGAEGHASPIGTTKHEATSINNGEGKGLPGQGINHWQHQEEYDDFSDSGDDIATSLLEPENFESRRKRRIVDLEDDD